MSSIAKAYAACRGIGRSERKQWGGTLQTGDCQLNVANWRKWERRPPPGRARTLARLNGAFSASLRVTRAAMAASIRSPGAAAGPIRGQPGQRKARVSKRDNKRRIRAEYEENERRIRGQSACNAPSTRVQGACGKLAHRRRLVLYLLLTIATPAGMCPTKPTASYYFFRVDRSWSQTTS